MWFLLGHCRYFLDFQQINREKYANFRKLVSMILFSNDVLDHSKNGTCCLSKMGKSKYKYR